MKHHNAGFLKLVEEARSEIEEIDFHQLEQMQQSEQSFTLIDVREESEWARGHIPGAIHLSKGIIERDIETKIPDRDRVMVLYCGGGFRSALVAYNLQKMGYRKLLSLAGGYSTWQSKRSGG